MDTGEYLKLTVLTFLISFTATGQTSNVDNNKVKDELLQFSKEYFEAFNTCNVDKTVELLSEDIEFYHDFGGFVIGKNDMRKMIDNVCKRHNYDWIKARIINDQKTFELLENGKLYGAIVTGELLFYNIDKLNGQEIKISTSSFTWVMIYKDNRWTISRDLSYNHQDIPTKN